MATTDVQYNVLYTHMKTQKKKIWQDGTLKVNNTGLGRLWSDPEAKGGCRMLDKVYGLGSGPRVGDDLESEKFLITVEAVQQNYNNSTSTITTPISPAAHATAPIKARLGLGANMRFKPPASKTSGFVVPTKSAPYGVALPPSRSTILTSRPATGTSRSMGGHSPALPETATGEPPGPTEERQTRREESLLPRNQPHDPSFKQQQQQQQQLKLAPSRWDPESRAMGRPTGSCSAPDSKQSNIAKHPANRSAAEILALLTGFTSTTPAVHDTKDTTKAVQFGDNAPDTVHTATAEGSADEFDFDNIDFDFEETATSSPFVPPNYSYQHQKTQELRELHGVTSGTFVNTLPNKPHLSGTLCKTQESLPANRLTVTNTTTATNIAVPTWREREGLVTNSKVSTGAKGHQALHSRPHTLPKTMSGKPGLGSPPSLQFPTAAAALNPPTPPARSFRMQLTFRDLRSYQNAIVEMIHEYLNLMLSDAAVQYHAALKTVDLAGLASIGIQAQPNSGRPVVRNWESLQRVLLEKRTGAVVGCTIHRRAADFWGRGGRGSRGRGRGGIRRVEDFDVSGTKAPQLLYIALKRRGPHHEYSKGDLWVISDMLDFPPGRSFVARSSFFGPNSKGEVEIERMSGCPPSLFKNGGVVHAIKMPTNASTEIMCLENAKTSLLPATFPLASELLGTDISTHSSLTSSRGGFKVPERSAAVAEKGKLMVSHLARDDLCARYIDEYSLNSDQAAALQQCADMFICQDEGGNARAARPIVLVHGVFGSGKSMFMAVLTMFVVELLEMSAAVGASAVDEWKLMISSTTNIAVDRILEALLSRGFDKFVRVGSARRISPSIMPFSTHGSAGKDKAELKDLQKELQTGVFSPEEKMCIRKSIERLRKGENIRMLGQVRVVAATIVSSSFECLENMKFPIVLLDEACQMTEPSSLYPIAHFSAQRLVMVGDPKQLAPTIEGPAALHDEGLEQSLFHRLSRQGVAPVMLRTQYRCHPSISSIANALVYEGRLIDGVSSAERLAVVPEHGAVYFCDVAAGREQGRGSLSNLQEARFVTALCQLLIESGVSAEQIGVIATYRKQATLISELLSKLPSHVDSASSIKVSTVDAFQGGEKEIVIFSCVRTESAGFIDNAARTNVALTRAKRHLFIAGHCSNLKSNRIWGRVIEHCGRNPGGVVDSNEFLDGVAAAINREANAEAEYSEAADTWLDRNSDSDGATGHSCDVGTTERSSEVPDRDFGEDNVLQNTSDTDATSRDIQDEMSPDTDATSRDIQDEMSPDTDATSRDIQDEMSLDQSALEADDPLFSDGDAEVSDCSPPVSKRVRLVDVSNYDREAPNIYEVDEDPEKPGVEKESLSDEDLTDVFLGAKKKAALIESANA